MRNQPFMLNQMNQKILPQFQNSQENLKFPERGQMYSQYMQQNDLPQVIPTHQEIAPQQHDMQPQMQLRPDQIRILPSDNTEEKQQAKELKPKEINRSVFKASFWDNFPMKRNNCASNKIIQTDFDYFQKNKIDPNKPLPLPKNFEWVELNPLDQKDLDLMTNFINHHYQRFDKTIKHKFLSWIFSSPTYTMWKKIKSVPISYWCIGVRTQQDKKIVGLVTLRPITYRVDEKYIQSFVVDFLVTHKQMRKKRLTPVLMKEILRRMAIFGFDTGSIINANSHLAFYPTVKTSQILFRPISLEKLSKTLFSNISRAQLAQLKERYENIQPTNDLSLIRFANLDDVPAMMEIYENYSKKYRFCPILNRKEFEHYFVPKNEMVYTYVITNATGVIKDFITFHAFYTNRGEKNAYLYYVSFINEVLLELFMKNILFIMKSNGFDMVFANDVMGISDVFQKKLDFKEIGEIWNSYLFNYNTTTIDKHECGFNRFF